MHTIFVLRGASACCKHQTQQNSGSSQVDSDSNDNTEGKTGTCSNRGWPPTAGMITYHLAFFYPLSVGLKWYTPIGESAKETKSLLRNNDHVA